MGRPEDDVRELILSRYGNIAAFSREAHIPTHILYSALGKGLRNAMVTTTTPICSALSLDLIEVANGNLSLAARRPIPAFGAAYGPIAADVPMETQEVIDELPIPAKLHESHPAAFIPRIKNNSMGCVLANGAMALVDPWDRANASGKAHVVAVGGQKAVVRRVIPHDNGMTLRPDSDDPTYRPIPIDYADEDAPNVTGIDRVVWQCSAMPWYTMPDAAQALRADVHGRATPS